jgi:hypothetical protein
MPRSSSWNLAESAALSPGSNHDAGGPPSISQLETTYVKAL